MKSITIYVFQMTETRIQRAKMETCHIEGYWRKYDFGAKPLPEPVLTCQKDPLQQTIVIFISE